MASPRTESIQLPEGVLWRRAETQLETRLGLLPGDRVAVLAPPERDVSATLSRRHPRVRFLQMGGPDRRPFGWDEAVVPGKVERVVADPFRPPFPNESVEGVVVVFPFPLLDEAAHRRLVEVWAPRIAPFGKWFSLVALDGPRDPRLAVAEKDLKQVGFEKVRSIRLALGRMGATLFLQAARWPGLDEDEDAFGDADDDEDDE